MHCVEIKLNEKYSVENGDTDLLNQRISEEESQENSDENNKRSESLKARVASWVKETDEVKSIYPVFSFFRQKGILLYRNHRQA